jgi:hypothetical protein
MHEAMLAVEQLAARKRVLPFLDHLFPIVRMQPGRPAKLCNSSALMSQISAP